MLEPWEGQPVGRAYHYPVRDIAETLVRVALGGSFRSSADWVRERAERRRPLPPGRRPRYLRDPNRHGQLVADWVEAFAPVLWAELGPRSWPKFVMLDSTSFRNAAGSFSILVATGQESPDGRARLWLAEGSPQHRRADWTRMLGRLDGVPQVGITDGDTAIRGALDSLAKTSGQAIELRACLWHLKRLLEAAITPRVLAGQPARFQLLTEDAFNSGADFARFCAAAHRLVQANPASGSSRRLAGWLGRHEAALSAQLAAYPTHRGPQSVGPTETANRALRQRLMTREQSFGNRERFRRLLMLMVLDINGQAEPLEWARIIREHLQTTGGWGAPQRQFADPGSIPSLRR